MFVNFAAILASLPAGTPFRIANATRPPGDYLFNTLLPERNLWTYHVESGNMTIRATMAGLVGMDSPYPPGGMVDASTFLEQTAKIANEIGLTEAVIRQIQQFLQSLAINNQPTNEAAQREVLNFLDKVVVQPHVDTMEWLRGQALTHGAINWTFNNKSLVVDYGVPSANKLATRSGTAAYGGSASVFWADIRLMRRTVKGALRIIAHPDTIDEIRYNPVNSLATVAETDGGITVRRLIGNNMQFSPDAGDTVTLIPYGLEAEVLDPANTSQTIRIPFMEVGKLLGVGTGARNAFRIGEGSTNDPNDNLELGYTHIGPTVEGGGRPGRWSDLFTPQHEPYSVRGRCVTNGLPVIESPDAIVIATTDMS